MYDVLFKRPKVISESEVLEKVKDFINKKDAASEAFKLNKSEGRKLAQSLRKELEVEHKNNQKQKTKEFYDNLQIFRNYAGAVQDSYANTTGNLDNGSKTDSFLYDVGDYMSYYFPELR